MGISENRNCKFCADEIDYLEHFFWPCGKLEEKKKSRNTHVYFKFNKLNQV